MYIWIACLLPEDFEKEVRSACMAVNQAFGISTTAFTLPQHISLKISFKVDDNRMEAVVQTIESILSKEDRFYVNLMPAERQEHILWMPAEDNSTLTRLHKVLDAQLAEKHNIAQHPFDHAFLFHSTLFLDTRPIPQEMEQRLKKLPLPARLLIRNFCIGISPDGTPGSYRIVRQIPLKNP